MLVTVPHDQLSLAIGKKGQNARLASRLIGWNIDIRSDVELGIAAPSTVIETSEGADAGSEDLGDSAEKVDAAEEEAPQVPESDDAGSVESEEGADDSAKEEAAVEVTTNSEGDSAES